jgi:hypothetical protein
VSIVLSIAAQLPMACGGDDRKSSVRGSEGGAGGAGGSAETPSSAGRDGGGGGVVGELGEGGTGPQQGIGLSDYCSGIAELYFDFLSNCYGATDYPASARDGFVANTLGRCLEVEPSVEAGRLAFDGVAAAACLAELEAADTCTPVDFLLRAPACTALFSPQTAVAQDCYKDATLHFTVIGATSECQAGYCAADQCPGTCEPWLEEGEACAVGQCGPDLACVEEACAPRRGEGEECPQEDACQDGWTCIGNVCRVPSQPGDSCYGELCSLGFNCIEGECWAKVEDGHVCTWRYDCSDDGRCLDRDGDGPRGLECGPIGELGDSCNQPVDCGPDLYCEREGLMVGTCESRLPLSAECDTDSCEAGAWCNYFAGLCQAVGEEGDDCLAGSMPGPKRACAGDLLCMSDGQCHPVGDVGDACHVRQAESCVEGTFCSRDGAVCAELAGMDEYCNPFLPQPCTGELGCLCTGVECATTAPSNQLDTLFICGSRRQLGEECFGEFECAGDSYCAVGEPGTCQAQPFCLP